jgi:hypothetical protein
VPRRTSYDVRVPEPPRLIRDSTAATQPRSLRQREAADRIVVPAHTRKVAAATRRLGPLQEKLTSCAGVAERARHSAARSAAVMSGPEHPAVQLLILVEVVSHGT